MTTELYAVGDRPFRLDGWTVYPDDCVVRKSGSEQDRKLVDFLDSQAMGLTSELSAMEVKPSAAMRGCFTVKAWVNGRKTPLIFLVDTGARLTCFKESRCTPEELKTLLPTRLSVKAVTSEITRCTGWLRTKDRVELGNTHSRGVEAGNTPPVLRGYFRNGLPARQES